MKLQLQAELFRRYPCFFRTPGKRLVQLNSGVDDAHLVQAAEPFDEWGVECGDGWFNLIDRLCRECEREIERLDSLGVPRERWPRVAQIKEKFGSLRFYARGCLPEELRELIQEISEKSRLTCELCGAFKKSRAAEAWHSTTCDDCTRKPAEQPLAFDKQFHAQLQVLLASRTDRGPRVV